MDPRIVVSRTIIHSNRKVVKHYLAPINRLYSSIKIAYNIEKGHAMKACIVGGGTAGWITLAYLAATTDLELTIIHSDEIDIIGVGESTTPAIRHVAKMIGVNETEWMRDGKATYKYGIDFLDWKKPGSRWFHSFDDTLPSQIFSQPLTNNGKTHYKRDITSIEYFLKLRSLNPSEYNIDKFNFYHGSQQFLLDNKLSPYSKNNQVNIGDFPGYAYHINAFDFGQSLRNHTPKHRFKEIVSTITEVKYNENGVSKLVLNNNTNITADIYFDCSGFHQILTKELTSFKEYTDLINDRVMFGPVKGYQSYKPATEAVAQKAGWIWATPTIGQIGSGHVYSSSFMSDEEAYDIMVKFWQERGQKWNMIRSLKFKGGRLNDIAIKNVISNGLGQSFLEPLEATSIMITCITVIEFAKQFNKHLTWNPKSASVLNKVLVNLLELTKDFIRYHYELSDRSDSDYWLQVRRPEAVQEVSDIIDQRVKKETLLNGFNWTSMLLGYDKPYVNAVTELSDRELEEYIYYVEMMQKHYEFLTKDNFTIEQYLHNINS